MRSHRVHEPAAPGLPDRSDGRTAAVNAVGISRPSPWPAGTAKPRIPRRFARPGLQDLSGGRTATVKVLGTAGPPEAPLGKASARAGVGA